ncbi:MAG: adenine phosphoribosyltransferase [Bacilli bacterium]|nr:adenine phosphoribosyltransferase [Bacilli bacterium]
MDYKKIIAIRENWPKKGISFKDITPLLANAKAFKEANELMAKPFKNKKITKILCADARGFLFGSVVAHLLNAGVVVSRKPGKLPYVGVSVSYDLEYGSNTLEIAPKMIKKNDRVLIVDDLLATGGSAKAMTKMVKKIGAKLVGYSFLIELTDLKARKILEPVEIHSLVKYKI